LINIILEMNDVISNLIESKSPATYMNKIVLVKKLKKKTT